MIERTVKEIASMAGGTCTGNGELSVSGVCIDSRSFSKENLYVPLIGARNDGHSFIGSVREKGGQVSFWQKDHLPYPEGMTLVLVDDTTAALQKLAKSYMESLSCLVIGITGSNGKTSCKDMLYSIFSTEKKTQKTQGNRNNELGLPLTILELDADCEAAILEMGMENKGEIDFLCTMARPDISLITTIGSAHMENLGSKIGIAQAKLEILDHTKPGGLFIYDKESPEIEICLKEKSVDPSIKCISFGKDGDLSLTSDIQTTLEGISFTCSAMKERIHVPLPGDVQAKNALACIAAARFAGIPDASILAGLRHTEMTRMRMQVLPFGKAHILDDSYKSNPESAKAAIDALMSLPAKVHIACLSDMLDLGPQEMELHAQIGAYAKMKKVDLLFGTGPLTKATVDGYNGNGIWFETKEEMIEAIKPYRDRDALILVKGSRAMAMDRIVEALRGNIQ